jgi:hypothetical protein
VIRQDRAKSEYPIVGFKTLRSKPDQRAKPNNISVGMDQEMIFNLCDDFSRINGYKYVKDICDGNFKIFL